VSELIHRTALVDPKVQLGSGVKIGPFCVVSADARLAADVELGPHVVLEGRVELGAGVRVGAGTVIGADPQDIKFKPSTVSGVRVGAGTVIREDVTIHRATKADGFTEVGAGCFLMSTCHIGHDSRIGDGAIIVTLVAVGGHSDIGEYATIGGVSGVIQFTRIGAFAFVGGCAKVGRDIPPYITADGNPCVAHGINVVGLRRAGMPPADRRVLQEAYRLLYRSGLAPGRALERMRSDLPPTPAVARLIEFVAAPSRRGIIPPKGGWRGAAAESTEGLESEVV
jgi:UDP-N-acetylglucosamine acyltransferase